MIELDLDGARDVIESRERKISQVFYDTMQEFFIVYDAFQEAVESRSKRPFLRCYNEIQEMFRMANNGELTDEEIKNIPELEFQYHERDLKILQRVLYDQYEFVVSPETMETFHEEMWVLFEARYIPQLRSQTMCRDLEFRLAKEKAMPAMGKAISLLRGLGRVKSDIPTKAGSTKYKGYVSYEEVIQAAKEVPKRIKSKRRIARVVRDRLVKNESGRENPKKVYEEDHIRQVILKEVWPEIL